MMDFNGKTVVVSGAAIGFGNAIAERFRAAGATVFGCDIADADRPFSDGVLLEKSTFLIVERGQPGSRRSSSAPAVASTSSSATPVASPAKPTGHSKT